MRYFQTEVESFKRAKELAKQIGEGIAQASGRVMVGSIYEQGRAAVFVVLPDDVNPDELLPPGFSFTEGHAVEVPAVEDQGIQE